MEDDFQLLELPRSPWLDPETVKERFRTLSNTHHPDRFHDASPSERTEAEAHYVKLNQASQRLGDLKQRLRYLLELYGHHKSGVVEQAPAELMDWFMELGGLSRKVQNHKNNLEKAESPILKAQLMGTTLELTEELDHFLQKINAKMEIHVTEIKQLQSTWPAEGQPNSEPLDQLASVYRSVAHLDRWQKQIQEMRLNLAF